MIKLNLMPGYVLEKGRIRTTIIVFLIILGLEGGVIYKAVADYKAQEEWFKQDMPYFTSYTEKMTALKTEADAWTAPAGTYDSWNTFFSRQPVVDYNKKYAEVMAEVPAKLGSSSAWFDEMTIDKNKVKLTGKIKGVMNFVEFYFKMKKINYKVKPGARPYPNDPVRQEITLDVEGEITGSLPEAPKPPKDASKWEDMYKDATAEAAAPAEGAPAEGAPAEGAPAEGTPAEGAPAGGAPAPQ